MNTFDLDEVTAILLASGWHRPDSRTLHRQTGTYWIDGQPTPMLRWTENGAPVYVPAANVLAVRSTKPPEPEVPVEPVAPPGRWPPRATTRHCSRTS
jgi:hypothetical protein